MNYGDVTVTVEVKVPTLPESVPDATVLLWRKSIGDTVEEDEILVELETDKVVLEVPAPQAGVLTEITKNDGDLAVADDVLGRIDTSAATSNSASAAAPVASTASPPALPAASAAAQLSPAVRKLVDEHRLDATQIAATGKGERITKGDVLAHLQQHPTADLTAAPVAATSAPAMAEPTACVNTRESRREPMSRLRQRIADRLVSAQQTAAILTTFNEINMQAVLELRSHHKDRFEKVHGVRLGFMSFFAKAAVAALQRYPAVNAYIEENEIVYHNYCDIGVAVGSPRGLVVPILRDVQRMSFAQIEQAINGFGERAKAGALTVEEMTGGTFTISNGGVFGSLLSTPILNPPQSAILGMHKTEDRAVVENGQVVVRPMMYLALSYDHRIIDGREAVLFLVAIKEALEDPARLLLEI
ncbi:MAG: 2-oxoglutarate dehydrogenase E2 component (dihydrolipoamide succinyltransferase) [Gammaproteobacteria bacterium]